MFGDEIVRVIETGEPRAAYPAAQQAADFGAPPAELRIVVRQLSAAVGPGLPAKALLAP